MTIVKANPSSLSSFSNLFDDFFNSEISNWRRSNFSSNNTTIPRVNIKEDTDGFVVEMAAPGMNKKDFNIDLDNNTLTISSQRKEESNENNGWYSQKEFTYQSFQRSFTLPKTANHEKINASYKNGILAISIPKKEKAKPKPPKTISIS